MITRDFSVISMTSQASLSLSLLLTKVTHAQYRKRFRASYNDDVMNKFDGYLVQRKNPIFERAKFNLRVQAETETVDQFVTALYALVEHCEYEGLNEQVIRDRLVVGLRDSKLSERLQ